MNAIETAFRRLHAAGVTIELDGELLRARPAPLVTPEIAELIRAHKPELLRCLVRSLELPRCESCEGRLIAIPTFDGFENLECISCDQCAGCRQLPDFTLLGVVQ